MKRSRCLLSSVLAVAILCGAQSAFAGTAVWIGNSGAWSDAANWQDGATPQAGDTVSVANPDASAVIDVDVADVSLASIRFEGATPVTLTGNGLTLTGGYRIVTPVVNELDFSQCVAGFLSYGVDVDCQIPLTFAPPSGNCGICVSDVTVNFRAAVTCTGKEIFYVHSGIQPSNFGTLNFHGEVNAPDATFRPLQHPTGLANFYAPMRFKDFKNYSWSREEITLNAPGNEWGVLLIDYGNKVLAKVNGVFPPNAVFSLGNTNVSGNDAGIVNLGNFNATIDRLGGDLDNNGTYIYAGETRTCGLIRSSEQFTSGAMLPVTLTMNATASDMTTFAIADEVSLVWNPTDDYTLTMTGRVHSTRGTIDVRHGGFRMAGACKFVNVPAITVGEGARFYQESTEEDALAALETLTLEKDAKISFPAGRVQSNPKAVVNIADGAKLALPDGAELRVAAVNFAGRMLDNGTYSGTDWIEGAGKVVIEAGTIAFWNNPQGGDWSDGSNWTSGKAPDGQTEKIICLTLRTAESYTVRIDQPLTDMCADINVGNAGGGVATLQLAADVTVTQANIKVTKGGLIDVPAGKTFTFIGPVYPGKKNAVTDERLISIENGGEWRTSGGTTVITNFCGTMRLTGSDAETVGKLTMTSGTFLFMNLGSQYPLSVMPNGKLDFTGGLFRLLHHGYNHLTDLKNCGGLVRYKDTEVNTTGKFVTSSGGSTIHGTGETRYEGTATLCLANGAKVVRPGAAGETAVVIFGEGATLPRSGDFIPWVLCGDYGKSVVNWDSGNSGNTGYFIVGADRGEGVLNVNSGTLRGHSSGLKVGAFDLANSGLAGIDDYATGRVTVKEGATLDINGSLDSGWGARAGLCSLVVGEGLTTKKDRYVYDGRVDVFGTLNVQGGNSAVGLGRAKGALVLHGGSATFQTSLIYQLCGQTIVGMAGGHGRVIVSNGTYTVKNGNLYVGGCSTNDLQCFDNQTHVRVPWQGSTAYPFDLRDADGKVTVVDGAVTVQNATVLGVDGDGALEMVGSNGSFTTKELLLNASTSSTLRFVPDASGVAPIRVSDHLAICNGAKIEVDITGFAGRRRSFKVLDTRDATVEGAFEMANVNVIGLDPIDQVRLVQDGTGVKVSVGRTSVIFIR